MHVHVTTAASLGALPTSKETAVNHAEEQRIKLFAPPFSRCLIGSLWNKQTNQQTNQQTSGHLNDNSCGNTSGESRIGPEKKVVDRPLPTSSHQRRKVSAKQKLQSVNQSIASLFQA